MSHCLLVWKQCLAAKIIMTNTNIVEFYFNNIQHVRYVICLIFKYLQQHCFPVYLINSIPLTKCQKNIHGPPLRPGDLEPNSRSIRVSFLKAPNMPPTAPPPPRRGKNQWAKSWADFFDGKMGNLNKLMGIYGDPLVFSKKAGSGCCWSDLYFVEKVSILCDAF